MLLFESVGALRVLEKLRSDVEGVMVRIDVKPGDAVTKGQLLGHLDLDASRHKLNLARHAVESKAGLESALAQADAWTVTREETEIEVRKRLVEKSRLDWAMAMERMYRANYDTKVEDEKAQNIEYEYCKEQFDKRHFLAPVDGIVSEVPVKIGDRIGIASHVFTVSNENTYALPIIVPDDMAAAAEASESVPVRSSDGKSVTRALVDSVMDDPRKAGCKIVKLLIKAADFPAATRSRLMGMKFDVLLPQIAADQQR